MTALSKQLETLKQKKAALREKEIAIQKALRKQQRLERERQYHLVGDVVLAQAAIDPVFAATLRDILAKAVTREEDRELLKPLFPLDKNAETPSNGMEQSQAVVVSLHPALDATVADQQNGDRAVNSDQLQSA
jgi:hypothetical protein